MQQEVSSFEALIQAALFGHIDEINGDDDGEIFSLELLTHSMPNSDTDAIDGEDI